MKVNATDTGQLPQAHQIPFMFSRLRKSVVFIVASIKARGSPNFVEMGEDYLQFQSNVVELLGFLEEADDVTATLEAWREIDVELDGLRGQRFTFQFVLKVLDHLPFGV